MADDDPWLDSHDFSKLEEVEGAFRVHLAELGYLKLYDATHRRLGQEQDLGSWQPDLDALLQAGAVAESDVAELGRESILARHAMDWLRTAAAGETGPGETRTFRVLWWAPKGHRKLGTNTFYADNLTQGGPDLVERMRDAPTLSQVDAATSVVGLTALQRALAMQVQTQARFVETASAFASNVVTQSTRQMDALGKRWDAQADRWDAERTAALAQAAHLQNLVERLVSKDLERRFDEADRAAKVAEQAVEAAETGSLVREGLETLRDTAVTLGALHKGLPPELAPAVSEIANQPDLVGLLRHPKFRDVLKDPELGSTLKNLLDNYSTEAS